MQESQSKTARASRFPAGLQNYTIIVLLTVYVLSYLDRQIVGILAESIKRDLRLSDTQVGLMAGFAFSVFYTLLGLPLARLADDPRSDRVGLIALAAAFWSAMTAACGLSQSFVQLLLARMGVGLGEAGSTPAAHALISEIVEPRRRASAMALYGMGLPIGSLLAFVVGGAMADAFGWRAAFLLMGAPGLLVALVLRLTVKDPRRSQGAPTEPARHGGLRQAAGLLLGSKVFVRLFLAATIIAFLGFGKAIWTASFMIRGFGLSPGEVGLWLGLGSGVAGVFGTWLGGALVARAGPRQRLAIPAAGLALAVPFLLGGYLATDWRVSMTLICLSAVVTNIYYGPMFGTVQAVIPQAARATAVAVISFGQNMIGLGLGPLVFGVLSDLLRPVAGADSLRWVLVAMTCLWPVPAILMWRAGAHLEAEARH